MVEILTTLRQTLKRQGYSLTSSRQKVFEALEHHEPQTMHELIVACPAIDRASVYRTIALFEKLGIIQRLQIGWKYKLELSDAFSHHHHHLSCIRCGTVVPLPEDKLLEKKLHSLAIAQGFSPQDHQLEIRGLCSACQ